MKDKHLYIGIKGYLNMLNTFDKPLEDLPAEEVGRMLADAWDAIDVDLSGIEESEKVIIQDGFKVKLTIIRPAGTEQSTAVFVYIHGTGYGLDDYSTHRRFVRDLVVASGIPCVFPDYSLFPESKLPQAINEIYATLKWVYENGEEIHVNGKNIALAGNGAGGTMAMANSLIAKDNNSPEIKLQVLLWPITDRSICKDIHISPVLASTEQLKGLPPTLLITAENDIVRDEGELLGSKLDEAGVDITTIRFNGVIHDWGIINGFAKLHPTKKLIRFISVTLQEYLLPKNESDTKKQYSV